MCGMGLWDKNALMSSFHRESQSNNHRKMKTCRKICSEGIVDVCIERFNKIKHPEPETSTLIYDITATYFHLLQSTIISELTKEQKAIIEKLGFADALF